MFGVPETIVSDNGTQFKAHDFKAFLTSYGITHVYTAFYSPQSNVSERVNRSLIAGIRAYIKTDHQLWDLSSICCALRNSHHQAINISPCRALFGLNTITHGSSYKLLKSLEALEEPQLNLQKEDHLHILRNDIKKHIKRAYENNRDEYNLRTRLTNVGQEVFRRNFAQSNLEKKYNSKLAPVFIKAKIREKLGSHYYMLEDVDGKLVGIFHAKDIRP